LTQSAGTELAYTVTAQAHRRVRVPCKLPPPVKSCRTVQLKVFFGRSVVVPWVAHSVRIIHGVAKWQQREIA